MRRTRGCAGGDTIALLIAAASLPSAGCSFLFVNPPPEHPAPYETANCTTSYAPPTIDIVMGVLELVSFGVVESSGSKAQKTVFQIFAIPLAGAQIGSGIGGYIKVSRCNELTAVTPYRPTYRPRPSTRPRESGPETTPAPPPGPRARQQMDDE